MRETTFDCQSFCIQLDRIMNEDRIRTKSAELLSRITPSASNNFQNEFVLRRREKCILICLAIYSWYAPEEIGILLRLALERYSKNEDFWFLAIMLESKASMKNFLVETRLWSSRDFFGNILTEEHLDKLFTYFFPLYQTKRRPRRVQRHRGYRDKGSLRISSDRHQFISGTREQQTIEYQREVLTDSYQFLKGFLLGG